MTEIIVISGVLFVAAFIRSGLGFGDALFSMPLITLVAGLKVASPLVAMVATTMSLIILVQSYRLVSFRSLLILLIATLPGVPLGIYILKTGNESILQMILGLIILLYALLNLITPVGPRLRNDRTAPLFGIIAGIMGGAYNTNGPPIVFYSLLRNWDPSRFRATMQAYFLPSGGAILGGHIIAGNIGSIHSRYYLYALPGIFLGILLGAIFHKKLNREIFRTLIYILLILLGGMLVIGAL